MRILNQLSYRQNFLLQTLFLRLMPKYRETCCVNTSRKTQNFWKNRNWPNSAPTLVSRRILTEDNSSKQTKRRTRRGRRGERTCREKTLPRSEESSRLRGWIRGNTKIGPVLDVKVCHHQGRYSVEIMIEYLFRDRTVSWVRIVNGINKYVTETLEEIHVTSAENRGTGKLVAMAKPRPKPTFTLTPVSILYREGNWIDVDPGKFSQGCFEVSKYMIRLLRHDDKVVPR